MHNKTQPTIRTWTHVQLSLFLLTIGLTLTLGLGGAFYIFISLDIPAIGSLKHYQPATTSIIYDSAKQPITYVSRENRTLVPLSSMPELLPQAFVAAEDSRFYQHSGVDAWSIIRALIHNIRSGERGQGGSTITQQVARALLLTPEKTYTRKIKEAILAYRIDKALSKEEILHIYLNQIYLGSSAYGVEAAAQIYFDKRVQDLDLAEVALLAGLPQAPSRYSPFRNFKLAKNRQLYVLNRMAEEGYITPTAAQKAFEKTLLWNPEKNDSEENNYFIEHVKAYVQSKYGTEALLTGGLRIYTTLDQNMQKAANMALKRGTAKWAIRQSKHADTLPQAALITMEVKTGYVRAMLGGTDFGKSQFNRATQARRQPGSAFKPFIYAAGLEKGMSPATMLVDEPIQFRGATSMQYWEPKNYNNKFEGPTSFRNALVHSRNIPTIKILQQVGAANTIDLARRLGITSPLVKDLSLALGTSGVSPLELTRAYAAFANSGRMPQALFIEKIVDRTGKVLEEQHPAFSEAVDPRVAYQITRIMEAVITDGTAKGISSFGAPAAGKTGTTDQNIDAWFVGYTPELTTCVWIGHDQNISLGTAETGGLAAAPIWLDFMNQAKAKYPGTGGFPVPPGIIMLPLDNATGKPGTAVGGSVTLEAFREDTPPWPQAPPPSETSELPIP
ncbi:MAG: penicillin-binding protein 1A [Desulfobulbaceae bacterium]|nr:penicillin-binding protein 1A [Desulfobulbaceae bacterium]HIJ89865.1 penicillin-binding protein 1A [Deltaproteobacteria bacterium]